MIKAAITGVHGFVPKDVLTNQDLEKIVDTTDEWITTRTGIKERRIIKDSGLVTSDLGAEAIKGLLAKTGTSVDEIDLVICATISGDRKFPDTANIIRDKVGIKSGFGFDLAAACSGFLFTLQTAAQYIITGAAKKVIVVGADYMSSIIDYTDRTTCVLFGDGAAAVLLEPSEEYGLEDAVLKSDGEGRHYLHLEAGGSEVPLTPENINDKRQYLRQEGRIVFKYAVNGMSGAISELMERNNLTNDDVNWLVPHQANKRIIDTIAGSLDFPMEKTMVNIQKYGNTTAATIPLCLYDYEKQLKKGDKLLLTAFGGGFTWGAMYLTWAYDGDA